MNWKTFSSFGQHYFLAQGATAIMTRIERKTNVPERMHVQMQGSDRGPDGNDSTHIVDKIVRDIGSEARV